MDHQIDKLNEFSHELDEIEKILKIKHIQNKILLEFLNELLKNSFDSFYHIIKNIDN